MSHDLIKELVSDILDTDSIMFSVNSGSGICEVKSERGLPVRVSDKWLTIGNDDKPWHIHLNLESVTTARFIIEERRNGMNGYSIRFFDTKGNIIMRANFVKMYDGNGNLISKKYERYDELFTKYGNKEIISFHDK
ncbi:MAG: ChuX/HutX family heme-like substrate-binding protein [Nitrososphaeraceae archaeon]|nr:ChuX/HutX family heme-like substrate-binding protein [Nitrososphaeraceae archaeon]